MGLDLLVLRGLLDDVVSRVQVVKFALGIAGVGAAAGIVYAVFDGQPLLAIFACLAVLVGMVVLMALAWAAKQKAFRPIRHVAAMLVYVYGVVAALSGLAFFSAISVGWPTYLAELLRQVVAINTPVKPEHSVRSPYPEEKMVVLVADFQDLDGKPTGITEMVLHQLGGAARAFPELVVDRLHRSISQEEGAAKAARLGRELNADLVLWGWVIRLGGELGVSSHIEVIDTSGSRAEEAQAFQQVRFVQDMGSNLFSVRSIATLEQLSGGMASTGLLAAGFALYYAGDFEAAAQRFAAASKVGLMPGADQADTLLMLSNCYYYLRDTDAAITAIDQALMQRPTFASAYSNRAVLLQEQGRFDEALSNLTVAIMHDPKQPFPYINRTALNFRLGDYEAMLVDAETVVHMLRQSGEVIPAAWINLATSYVVAGRREKAIAVLDDFLANPGTSGFTDIRDQRAWLHLQIGNAEVALREFEGIIRDNPNYASAHTGRGKAARALKDNVTAIEGYRRAIELDPKDVLATNGLVYALLSEGRPQEAMIAAESLTRLEPQVANSFSTRADVYIALEQWPEAISDLELVLTLSNDPAERRSTEERLAVLRNRP